MDGQTDCQMETQADRHKTRVHPMRTGGVETEHSSLPPLGPSEPSSRSLPHLPHPTPHPGPRARPLMQ